MSGIGFIAIEREEQMTTHGYVDDTQYVNGELVDAAACYLGTSDYWPWDEAYFKYDTTDDINNLKKAGALIAAEIDRLIAVKNKETNDA